MAKRTRITVDLGDEGLFKALKFAAVEQGKPVREIVIEALRAWLDRGKPSGGRDFQAMIRSIDEYRKASD